MDPQHKETPVHIIFRYPFKRPADFQPPQLKQTTEEWSLEEQVWRCLLSLPGPDRPQDILAELEQDEVTFDWELLASTLQVSLSQVFEAASNLFIQHLGRPLDIAEESIQFTRNIEKEQQIHKAEKFDEEEADVADGAYTSSAPAEGLYTGNRNSQDLPPAASDMIQEAYNSESMLEAAVSTRMDRHSSVSLDLPPDASDFDRAGMRSVESLGREEASEEPVSPVVNLGTATPDDASDSSKDPNEKDNQASYPQDSDRSMQTASVTTRHKDISTSNAIAESQYLQKSPVLANRGPSMHIESQDDQVMRQSMLADAMGSRFEPASYTQTRRNTTAGIRPSPNRQNQQRDKQIHPVAISLNNRDSQQPTHSSTRDEKQPESAASSLSFSDLSASSLTESAMQDALLSEAMNASTTMSSILGSRVFPWSKKKKKPQKNN
ncbi:hypothetical protein IW140_000807 [Coemansia sp. RSA 1813]|nr:hypothetical protein EV178_006234 [Coemansia sp. RSA 1646]KAJ1765923.1 hypothetical protein LPJ74_006143 [Coemansia sp. RSA 1843]KAJ2093349.1 hypothetical protein IW138_000199 [Coemansia sp. RSA 986]KAJ2217158.1 hypothetical protein EV179_000625 [Coemansia sp. RSA 487]KAJ2572356.1 hypothetical protein IW140_000807 [Coemansia sp. RSA 1813]